MAGTITDVKGILVGHAHDLQGLTGCTVVLCNDQSCPAGMDRRGMATSTRQVDSLMETLHTVPEIDAVLIVGGSAFGLGATNGVLDWFRERQRGVPTLYGRVPICPTAAIFDLGMGDPLVYPTPAMAYQACATAGQQCPSGSVGAGTGATVGKVYSAMNAMKGGVGTASRIRDDLVVGALAVVNAFGDIVDPAKGSILAGARTSPHELTLVDTAGVLLGGKLSRNFRASFDKDGDGSPENTTICVVATNARLDRLNVQRLARMVQTALPHVIQPVNTPVDGDVVFTLATGEVEASLNQVAMLAADALVEAVLDAVISADGFGRLPDVTTLRQREADTRRDPT